MHRLPVYHQSWTQHCQLCSYWFVLYCSAVCAVRCAPCQSITHLVWISCTDIWQTYWWKLIIITDDGEDFWISIKIFEVGACQNQKLNIRFDPSHRILCGFPQVRYNRRIIVGRLWSNGRSNERLEFAESINLHPLQAPSFQLVSVYWSPTMTLSREIFHFHEVSHMCGTIAG